MGERGGRDSAFAGHDVARKTAGSESGPARKLREVDAILVLRRLHKHRAKNELAVIRAFREARAADSPLGHALAETESSPPELMFSC